MKQRPFEEYMKAVEDKRQEMKDHLSRSKKIVDSWPRWKQDLLGKKSPSE